MTAAAELPPAPAWWLGLGLPADPRRAAKARSLRLAQWSDMGPERRGFILSAIEPSPPKAIGR